MTRVIGTHTVARARRSDWVHDAEATVRPQARDVRRTDGVREQWLLVVLVEPVEDVGDGANLGDALVDGALILGLEAARRGDEFAAAALCAGRCRAARMGSEWDGRASVYRCQPGRRRNENWALAAPCRRSRGDGTAPHRNHSQYAR